MLEKLLNRSNAELLDSQVAHLLIPLRRFIFLRLKSHPCLAQRKSPRRGRGLEHSGPSVHGCNHWDPVRVNIISLIQDALHHASLCADRDSDDLAREVVDEGCHFGSSAFW